MEKIIGDYRILLASQSPRRRELLKGLDIEYTLAAGYEVDETPSAATLPIAVARELSLKKSAEYPFPLLERDIVITADTVVIVGDSVLGKPASKADAAAMLRALSGREHTVVTGVTFRCKERFFSFDEATMVRFAALDNSQIDYYLDRYAPYDKAGAYGIQEWIGYVAIERIEGSFYNVMGLPVCRLYKELKQFIHTLNKINY